MWFKGMILLVLVGWGGLLKAQEMKYIDISNVRQRTELRVPPVPSPVCEEGKGCTGGGYEGFSIGDGAADRRDPHALAVYLLRVTPTDINPAEPFEVEFKIVNSGTAPIELPVSPHLSDLQPTDETVDFDYFSLGMVVRVEGEPQGPPVNSSGFVELFGSSDHPESMMRLLPGEWIRVSANVKLVESAHEPVSARFQGAFFLRKNTFRPHPGGLSREGHNLYPNDTPTPFVSVRLVPRKNPE
jgi:hypothetical protein